MEEPDYHKAPDNPYDGQVWICQCSHRARFVVLDDETGEGEWETI